MWVNLHQDITDEFAVREGCLDLGIEVFGCDAFGGEDTVRYYICTGLSIGVQSGFSTLEEKRNLNRRSRAKLATRESVEHKPVTLDRYWARRILVSTAAAYGVKAHEILERAHFAVMRQLREERPDRGYSDLMEALEFETHKLGEEAA